MKRNYFVAASVLILALTLIAFSDNLFTDVGQESNRDPKFIVHGLLALAWVVLLVIQTNFVRKENYHAHRRLGILGVIVAVGVTLSTLWVFVVIWQGWDALPFFAKANRFFLPTYALLVLLGYLNRAKPVRHKRFMFMATLYMLGPVLDRASGHLNVNVFILNPVIWNGLWASLFLYDWITLRRIHPITWVGLVWFYSVWTPSIRM
ncbi:hypothetical protein BH23GEM11_BH23GEM11_06590 [soil metagenome]